MQDYQVSNSWRASQRLDWCKLSKLLTIFGHKSWPNLVDWRYGKWLIMIISKSTDSSFSRPRLWKTLWIWIFFLSWAHLVQWLLRCFLMTHWLQIKKGCDKNLWRKFRDCVIETFHWSFLDQKSSITYCFYGFDELNQWINQFLETPSSTSSLFGGCHFVDQKLELTKNTSDLW